MNEEFMIDLLKGVFPSLRLWASDDIWALLGIVALIVVVAGCLLGGLGRNIEFIWGYIGVVALVASIVLLVSFCVSANGRRNARLFDAALHDKEVYQRVSRLREDINWLRDPANARYPEEGSVDNIQPKGDAAEAVGEDVQ